MKPAMQHAKQVSFARTFSAGMALEWNRLRQSPGPLLLLVLVAGSGLAVGLRQSGTSLGNLRFSMFFTVISLFWGWHATAAATAPSYREVLVARAVDEWALHLARLVVSGLYGSLLSLLFAAMSISGQLTVPALWLPLFKWLPPVVLAHTLAAAAGGLAAMVSGARQAVAPIVALGLWGVAVALVAPRWGSTGPDMLLRVLQWSPLLQDSAGEPLFIPLLLGFLLATVFLCVLSLSLFGLLQRRQLPVVWPNVARLSGWVTVACILAASQGWAATRLHAREGALAVQPADRRAAQNLVITWHPDSLSLQVADAQASHALQGPVRRTAVELSAQAFQPYIGRNGVLVPLDLLLGPGAYQAVVAVPDGWEVYGCASRSAANPLGITCAGTEAETDWLVLLPGGRVQEAERLTRLIDPDKAEAQRRFRQLLDAAFANLGRPRPEVLPLDQPTAWWLGDQTVAAPGFPGHAPREQYLRTVSYQAASILTAHLAGERHPWLEFHRPEMPAPDGAPVALLATLDRLLFETGLQPLDPLEREYRLGGPALVKPENYSPPIPPRDGRAFNEWWLTTDRLLREGTASPADLWSALSEVDTLGEALSWPETVRTRWHAHPEVRN